MRPTAVLARDALGSQRAEWPRYVSEAGFDVWLVPQLYHLPEDSTFWGELANLRTAIVFLFPFHPRPIEMLARRHGAWRDECLAMDLRAWKTPVELAAALRERIHPPSGTGTVRTVDAPTGLRWYPLVDESRCTHCGCCLQFCLFGVYEADAAKKIRIVHPDQCKPGCPACSRICPHGALIFPLYGKDEAIAGAPGKFPKPDAAARRMYYARTGLACPRCGQTGKPVVQPNADTCEECGRARVAAPTKRDELDALLDGLEQLQEGQR